MEEVEALGEIIVKKDNQDKKCDILFIFENNNQKYVGYTDYSIEDKRTKIYVDIYNETLDINIKENITKQEKFNLIQKVLNKIASQKKEDLELMKIYNTMQEDIAKYTSLSKKTATTHEEQIKLEEEKEQLEENIKQARRHLPKELLEEWKNQKELKIKVNKNFRKDVQENHRQYKIIPII